MRSLIRLTLATTAVAAIACGKTKAPTASMSDDLKRDLQLATSQAPNMSVSPDELGPKSAPSVALKLKKAAGPKVIRSATPTVRASATPKEVAEIQAEIPQVQVVASAPSESESPAPSAPPTARPAPIPMPTYPGPGPAAGAGSGGQGSGGGIGSVLGGIFGGVVIRGGGVGDDHCDPIGDRRRGGRPGQGGVFVPNPNGGISGAIGGIGGARSGPVMRPRGR